MNLATERPGFVVVRVDRRGELPASFLRSFALAGRNGLQRLAFDERAAAHVFGSRAEAEDIARRLHRRVSGTEHDYQVEEVAREVAAAVPE